MRKPLRGAAVAVSMLGTVAVLATGCSDAPPIVSRPAPVAGPGSHQLSIWLTGYSFQDNTPPGSPIVGEPVLHKVASGSGTFADPITVAVPGHEGKMDWKPGTKFYLPTVQRYVIVEDSGAAPPPSTAQTHLDMWVEGKDGTKEATDACESEFTGNVPAQVNPPDGLPVMAGPIFAAGRCNVPPQPEDLGTYVGSGGAQPRHHSQGNGSDEHANNDNEEGGNNDN